MVVCGQPACCWLVHDPAIEIFTLDYKVYLHAKCNKVLGLPLIPVEIVARVASELKLKLKKLPYITRSCNELVLGGGVVGFVRPS